MGTQLYKQIIEIQEILGLLDINHDYPDKPNGGTDSMLLMKKKKINGNEQMDDQINNQVHTEVQTSVDTCPDQEGMENNKVKSEYPDRIRFTCDISRACHRRLKVFAANSSKTINQAVVDLIIDHCNSNGIIIDQHRT